jgi:hypothetical protein
VKSLSLETIQKAEKRPVYRIAVYGVNYHGAAFDNLSKTETKASFSVTTSRETFNTTVVDLVLTRFSLLEDAGNDALTNHTFAKVIYYYRAWSE